MEEGAIVDLGVPSSELSFELQEQPGSSELNSKENEPSYPTFVSSQQQVDLEGLSFNPGPLRLEVAELPSNQNEVLSLVGGRKNKCLC